MSNGRPRPFSWTAFICAIFFLVFMVWVFIRADLKCEEAGGTYFFREGRCLAVQEIDL